MQSKQIKTHFDKSIILFFIGFFLLSCILLAFQINNKKDCNIEGFTIQNTDIKAKDLVTFIDTTANASKWEWTFGDGTNVSYLSKATHTYEKEGTYLVTLKVDNECVVEKEIKVAPYEEKMDNSLMPVIDYPKTATVGVPVSFSDKSPHAKSWQWMFGEKNGDTSFDSTEKNPTYTFKTPGVKKVTLAVNGNYKYVKKVEIFVKEPEKKKEEKLVLPEVKLKKKRGPEIKDVTEEDIEAMMRGIAKDELSYKNFAKHFCKDAMPKVHLRDGRIVSLKEMDEDIRNNSIKIKSIAITKDEDGCVTRLDANYKK
ncbi:MAG: PKD domain-containing protein [Limnohabitans sp.]|nr:PKD domain-containing protein [Limnohabitans sp.]